ncbi:MAG: tRNA pseudouridine(38-40) synthase TruA [Flavobacteriales bacterium]|jgi:tRNA pseudouridine38-40 synthase|nr:tRNA pseudouridine(38-40) synthase TruA [Flavobacteriales bacterium]
MRYFVQIAYNGKDFHGWQVQPNANTVQAEVNKALTTYFNNGPIHCVGCGRTDTGVHASDFYLHFDIDKAIDTEETTYRINRILPFTIVVKRFIKVEDHQHTRFDALSRTYEYHIHTQKNPFILEGSLFYPYPLDIKRMNEACQLLFNYSDFTSFSKVHSDAKTNICKIMYAKWEVNNDQIVFTIQADRFLRNMVRAIVGTLLKVGQHKLSINDFANIIEAKDRCEAGKSVDGKGLYLSKVEYDFID